MSTLTLVLLIVVPLALLLAGGLALLFRARRDLRRRMQERFGSVPLRRLTGGANFFGLRSKAALQVRGNGVLALTQRDLVFLLAVPAQELVIPLAAVRTVTLPDSFLGRGAGRPLLCVDFDGPEGPDAAAWAVQDAAEWRRTLMEPLASPAAPKRSRGARPARRR